MQSSNIDIVLGTIQQELQMAGFRLASKREGSEIVLMRTAPCSEHIMRISPYAAACLSGVDPALYDGVRLAFAANRGRNMERIEMQYDGDDVASALEPETDYGRTLNDDELRGAPETIKSAVARLVAEGFCVRGIGGGAMMTTITMTRGRKVGSAGFVRGIRAELTWLGN